jgi:hypothetical protein
VVLATFIRVSEWILMKYTINCYSALMKPLDILVNIIDTVCLFVVCFPAVTTHCSCIFHSPIAGFSLLVFEVS